MQTNFAPEQLQNPRLAEADRNLAAQIPYWENWSHDRDESFE